jgi:chorismate synthase
VIVEGVPAGLSLVATRDIDPDLRRRQGGHGRGKRQQIEHDTARIVSGVRGGRTLGSPITLVIENRDWENWQGPMQVEARGFKSKRVTRVRPGHADLAGVLKYGFDDARDVLERASARETAARVAAGAVGRTLIAALGIDVRSCVIRIGDVNVPVPDGDIPWEAVERSPVRCADEQASALMVAAIDAARENGDTLGGTAYVVASGVPAGLGSYVHWDRKLDGLIAQAMCSIPSVKGVELGAAVLAAQSPGSQVHDEPRWDAERGFHHLTNRQGGLAGGVTDGEPVWALVHFKPISTLLHPLRSVDIHTGTEINAHYERSDICVVPAGAVVAEAMLAWVLAAAAMDKFGGDNLGETRRAAAAHRRAAGRLR